MELCSFIAKNKQKELAQSCSILYTCKEVSFPCMLLYIVHFNTSVAIVMTMVETEVLNEIKNLAN